ncbi:MAG: outer membrane protein assembly factor BamE, partial [Pseudomonadota bacterium]|nr:outer membrane protein assembly factor BamE [Pseudomonadota bacterium]
MPGLPPLKSGLGAPVCSFLAALLLGSCSFFAQPLQPRGDRVDGDQIRQLKPGTTTESETTALLGSPTGKGTFDQNTW